MLTAETVDRIVRFDGEDLPVLSLYVPVDIDPGNRERLAGRVSSLLDSIDALARDPSAEHAVRMSVRADMERIREAVVTEHWRPGGMAIFACSGRDLYDKIPLPRRVRDRVMVDTRPYARPLLAVLDEYHRTCVAVVDKTSARFWEIYQDEMREAGKLRDPVLRKSNYAAGLAEDRVRNKADELTKRHYRTVVQQLEDLFRAGGFDLLIIGSHDVELPAFLDFLPRDLRSALAGTFSMDPDQPAAAEVRRHADAILERHEQAGEQQLLGDVFEKLAAGGLAAAGLDDCLWAGSVAAIKILLALDGAAVPGVVCDQSGWLARSGDICPFCGNPTRSAPDVIDELAEAVITEGGSVRHVSSDRRLAGPLVAASLRFPLPPRS